MKRLFFSLCATAVGFALALQFPATATGRTKTQETVLHSFAGGVDGAGPTAGLIDVGGTLYGTTAFGGSGAGGTCKGYGCGTVFSVAPKTSTEKVVYTFCSQGGGSCTDGAGPTGGLIDVKGTLYGTTEGGGSGNTSCSTRYLPGCGTIFSVNPTSGTEIVIYSFCSQSNCADGSEPTASLIDVKGTLYGTTTTGGSGDTGNCYRAAGPGCGTVFSVNPTTGAETVLYSFCSSSGCVDGYSPEGSLIAAGGKLYGTTEYGGAYGDGTVFSLDLRTGAEKVLHSFCNEEDNCPATDGSFPLAGLIEANGTLYGTTSEGGGSNCGGVGCGTVFSLDAATGAETILYSFCTDPPFCEDGEEPIAGLTDANGTLYGTTIAGGTSEGGTVFSLTPDTVPCKSKTGWCEAVVYSFCNPSCTDGEQPAAGLIDIRGRLYGTTEEGGGGGGGTVFAIKNP